MPFDNTTGIEDIYNTLSSASPHGICDIWKIRLDTTPISYISTSACSLRVFSNCSLMSWEDISDGYLQGSSLGWVLINIFINGLKEWTKNTFGTFAENASLKEVASSNNKMRIQNVSDIHKINIKKKYFASKETSDNLSERGQSAL